jgi:hypothetical protein
MTPKAQFQADLFRAHEECQADDAKRRKENRIIHREHFKHHCGSQKWRRYAEAERRKSDSMCLSIPESEPIKINIHANQTEIDTKSQATQITIE